MEINPLLPERSRLRIWDAKQRARPEISKREEDWWAQSFHSKEILSIDAWAKKDNMQRIKASQYTLNQFRAEFESKNRPIVIVEEVNDWPAMHKWTIPKLRKKYRNQYFKCGEDDNGKSVKLKMKYFVDYMLTNKDDSPLYIFDGSFSDHKKKKQLLDDFTISKFFPDDLFAYGGESSRPPYRWFVMGPARSGTGIHIDPLGTSAWNALVVGHKLWCLFPPNTPKQLLVTNSSCGKNKDEAICWFDYVYPKTLTSSWNKTYKPIHILQRPGETVFVPYGWWHVVLNLDHTIAVTQNFASPVNFPICWFKLLKGRPKFSKKLKANLLKEKPDLMKSVMAMNPEKVLFNIPESSASESDSTSSSDEEGSNIVPMDALDSDNTQSSKDKSMSNNSVMPSPPKYENLSNNPKRQRM